MKNRILIIWFFILFFHVIVVFAQSESIQKIPLGMEKINKTGSGQVIVPKGAKTRKVGAHIIVESDREYMSRRFFEMEERFKKLEKDNEELRKEVRELKKVIKTLKRATFLSDDNK